jgi:hypothetical protein
LKHLALEVLGRDVGKCYRKDARWVSTCLKQPSDPSLKSKRFSRARTGNNAYKAFRRRSDTKRW